MKLIKSSYSRRKFVKNSVKITAGTIALANFPTIIPASVFGKNVPSNKIHIAQIGCGRIARTHDLPEIFKYDRTRIMAIAEVDRIRLQEGKKLVERWYSKKTGKENYADIKTYEDYHELLGNTDIDAVILMLRPAQIRKQCTTHHFCTIQCVWCQLECTGGFLPRIYRRDQFCMDKRSHTQFSLF